MKGVSAVLIELIKLALKQQLTYVFFFYGLSFIVMFYFLFRALKNSYSPAYGYVFWMLAGFAVCKGFSVWADAVKLIIGEAVSLYGITAYNISTMFAVIANVFILQFSISLMTNKVPYKNIYQAFPVILFGGYLMLFMLGLIESYDANIMGRYSFGYNGGILTSVALFNLYNVQKQTKNTRLLMGIIGLAVGFALYSIFDGIAEQPILRISIYYFRMICAILLAAASFFIKDLFTEKKRDKVGYV